MYFYFETNGKRKYFYVSVNKPEEHPVNFLSENPDVLDFLSFYDIHKTKPTDTVDFKIYRSDDKWIMEDVNYKNTPLWRIVFNKRGSLPTYHDLARNLSWRLLTYHWLKMASRLVKKLDDGYKYEINIPNALGEIFKIDNEHPITVNTFVLPIAGFSDHAVYVVWFRPVYFFLCKDRLNVWVYLYDYLFKLPAAHFRSLISTITRSDQVIDTLPIDVFFPAQLFPLEKDTDDEVITI